MSKFYKPRNNGKKAVIGQGSQSRAAAAKILAGVETGQSLSDLMPRFTAELDLRDRALVSEIVHGTLRHRRLLNLSLHPVKFQIPRSEYFTFKCHLSDSLHANSSACRCSINGRRLRIVQVPIFYRHGQCGIKTLFT